MSTPSNYDLLTRQAALVDLSRRTQLTIRGEDRLTFLQNLCTNNVQAVSEGEGCEIFFTNVQGKIVGHGFVFVERGQCIFDTVAEQGKALLTHLDRYLIREDVELVETTADRACFYLAGPQSADLLSKLDGTIALSQRLSHQQTTLAGLEVTFRRIDLTATGGMYLECSADNKQKLSALLTAENIQLIDYDTFETARVEHKTPFYGQDITAENLPQEVARDAEAISFTKGCYLGQETIARIDALGHVNKVLRQVRFPGTEIPPAETEIVADAKTVGRVTSAVFSPLANAPVALAYLRTRAEKESPELTSAFGKVEVLR